MPTARPGTSHLLMECRRRRTRKPKTGRLPSCQPDGHRWSPSGPFADTHEQPRSTLNQRVSASVGRTHRTRARPRWRATGSRTPGLATDVSAGGLVLRRTAVAVAGHPGAGVGAGGRAGEVAGVGAGPLTRRAVATSDILHLVVGEGSDRAPTEGQLRVSLLRAVPHLLVLFLHLTFLFPSGCKGDFAHPATVTDSEGRRAGNPARRLRRQLYQSQFRRCNRLYGPSGFGKWALNVGEDGPGRGGTVRPVR